MLAGPVLCSLSLKCLHGNHIPVYTVNDNGILIVNQYNIFLVIESKSSYTHLLFRRSPDDFMGFSIW